MEIARAAGFAVPDTRVIASPAAGEHPMDDGLFPAVIKPHRSVIRAPEGRRKLGVSFVNDVASCRRVLRTLPPGAFPVLLQQRVRGPGEGLFVLRWGGRVVAVFAHRRLREKPPAGGVSVYRESITPGFRFLRAGLRLLDALEWNGLAMIECKRDPATGRHVIMEVNGRLWGSLQLAIDAGVDRSPATSERRSAAGSWMRRSTRRRSVSSVCWVCAVAASARKRCGDRCMKVLGPILGSSN